jgi:hypothetical protein
MDPERERKAHEFAIRRSDELAAEWERTEGALRAASPPADRKQLADAFVSILRQRIDAVVEGYLRHAIDEPYTKYDREFLARKAMEEAERVIEHVRERFGAPLASQYQIALEGRAVDVLKTHLDPL